MWGGITLAESPVPVATAGRLLNSALQPGKFTVNVSQVIECLECYCRVCLSSCSGSKDVCTCVVSVVSYGAQNHLTNKNAESFADEISPDLSVISNAVLMNCYGVPTALGTAV